jgi:hypothetical protein
MTREAFLAAQAAIRALRDEDDALRASLEAEAAATVRDAALLQVPRVRKTPKAQEKLRASVLADRAAACALVPDVADAAWAQARDAYDTAYEAIAARREVLEAQLRDAAAAATVEPGEGWLPYARVYCSSYSTQGYGASGYAQRDAEMQADAVRSHGIEATVTHEIGEALVPAPGPFGHTYHPHESWVVAVRVASEVDVAILKEKPRPPIKEIIRGILKRGGNPRVLFPLLPWGAEAKLGLDYFGNDLSK